MPLPEVISIGEALIDLISDQIGTLGKVSSFRKCPGGAPANFAVGMARLGVKIAFIGKVGADPFGKFLVEILGKEGVITEQIVKATLGERTALAFVSLDENGERDFLFYRKDAADLKLLPEEIKPEFFSKVKYLIFSSVSLSEEPSRSATFRAVEECKKKGGKVCFDPNIRLDLWTDEKLYRKILDKALGMTDIFLPSAEELFFVTREDSLKERVAIEKLFDKYPIEMLILKKGKEGCLIKTRVTSITIPSFTVPVKDTTGAGDGFNAGFIFGLLQGKTLEDAGILGNAVGALVVQKKGAMTALPTKEELKRFIDEQHLDITI